MGQSKKRANRDFALVQLVLISNQSNRSIVGPTGDRNLRATLRAKQQTCVFNEPASELSGLEPGKDLPLAVIAGLHKLELIPFADPLLPFTPLEFVASL